MEPGQADQLGLVDSGKRRQLDVQLQLLPQRLHRFSYSLGYQIMTDEIVVRACRHVREDEMKLLVDLNDFHDLSRRSALVRFTEQ